MTELNNLLVAISKAYCNLDYYDFLERTGFLDSQYSMDKFRLFQQSAKGLLQFDPETLSLLLKG